jgi:PiT family inorganic phosphate transporter
VAKAGLGSLVPAGLGKTALFIVLSPLLGMVLGFLFMATVMRLCLDASPSRVDKLFRRLQLVSAAFYSLGHGTNDAQKTMGIIAGLLFSAGYLGPEFHVPFWVILAAHAAIALGTLSGGWRIVKTMGMRITKLQPVGGFCAESAGALMLIGTAVAGIPVSTTHTITGAIVGVGATSRLSAVRWGIAGRIVWAWVLTIPAAALIAALSWSGLSLLSRGSALLHSLPVR